MRKVVGGLSRDLAVCSGTLFAMLAGLSATEALGFLAFGVEFETSDLLRSIAIGLGASLAFGVGAALVCARLDWCRRHAPSLAALVGSLSLAYAMLLVWIAPLFSGAATRRAQLLVLLALFAILAAVGRMGWRYVMRLEPDLVRPRFQAIAAMSLVSVGLYGPVSASVADPLYHALATLALLLLLPVGQSLVVRIDRARLLAGASSGRMAAAMASTAAGLCLAAAVGSAVVHAGGLEAGGSKGPPVILISIDTLRADHLSINDEQAPATPHMDALAHDGVNFTQIMAPAPWTAPSVASMLTGLYPTAVGAGALRTGPKIDYTGPAEAALTLAEVFRNQGYATAAITNNPWLDRGRGFGQGFQLFEDIGEAPPEQRFLVTRCLAALERLLGRTHAQPPGAAQVGAIRRWLEDRPDGSFFLWIHFIDPHVPYLTHAEYPPQAAPGLRGEQLAGRSLSFNRHEAVKPAAGTVRHVRQRYAGEVRFTDDLVGKIIGFLKDEGIYDESLICLTSDHGEELWDHGSFTHGHNFYDATVHVPLVIKLPGNEHAGKSVDKWLGARRLGATLLDAVDIETEFPGASMLPCVEGGDCEGPARSERFWFIERPMFGRQRSAVGDVRGTKVILDVDGNSECYDLRADPEERHPLDGERCPWPEDAESPTALLASFLERSRAELADLGGGQTGAGPADDEERSRLRSLGYLD